MIERAIGRWVMRHRTVGWRFHGLVHRGIKRGRFAEHGCWVCRAVWAALMAEPRFAEGLRAGLADTDAGRWYRWDTAGRRKMANPGWPLDGEQPTSTRGEWVEA